VSFFTAEITPAVMPISERDHDRHAGELDRDRQLLQDQLGDRLLDAHRGAEVALQHARRQYQ
jgi:hypothetical protein